MSLSWCLYDMGHRTKMDATITDIELQETDEFPWGAIKWLCNDQIDPESKMTFGTVYINAGQSNPLHYHLS